MTFQPVRWFVSCLIKDRDTIVGVSRPHRRRLSDVQMPAVHVESLTNLSQPSDVVIALPDVIGSNY